MSGTKATHWRSIQIMRGLAAAIVVAHHIPHYLNGRLATALPSFEFGAIGVDVFFIISGFVMYSATTRPPYNPAGFFVRRLARIIPLYWLLTSALALATWVAPSAFSSFTVSAESWVKSLLFIPVYDARGYIRPVLGQGWTLHFEMLFYTTVALVMVFARSRPTEIAALVLGGACLAVNLAGLPLLGSAWQLLAPLALEFSAGVLLAFIFHRHPPRIGSPAVSLLVAAVLWCLGIGLGTLGHSTDLGFARVGTWGIAAFAFVFGALLLERFVNEQALSARGLTLLGEASYSLYLVHGMTFSVSWKLLPPVIKAQPLLAAAGLLAVAIAVSIPLHKLIELRLNQAALTLGKRWLKV